MWGVDGGQRCDQWSDAVPCDRVPEVQPALGVGDDVDFAAPCFGHDAADAFGQFPGAVRYRCGGLVVAVQHDGAVAFQFGGHSPPVVEQVGIAEEDAVHQQDRVSGGADALLRATGVQLFLGRFEDDFALDDADDPPECDEVGDGYPPAEDADDPPFETELHR